ncbi:DUF6880 family protein [Puniceibacterium sediminis]|uniref:Uncharacterized protein n=1 Tax=Puniceibacterium sediminis TaxID=1608407 RepID=A0A238XKR6_9RHOB|nr:DUF6880 family protein [Puniceibacterium sediminis]SNR58569.1 hypothetical protein SAMN06265370_111110 [Puniceibacterium sediminis]
MSKKTLNAANLTSLGAERLAELLIDVSQGSAEIKRRLRLELSHNLGPQELARDVRKRLVSLRKSTSHVSWRKRAALVRDLATQAEMITDRIAPEDASLGFDLLWDFIALAPSVYERVDDSRGEVGDVFRAARARFEDIAPRASLEPEPLARRVWDAVRDNGYGEFDGIITLLAPSLGETGLAQLGQLVDAYEAEPLEEDADTHAALQFLRDLRSGRGSYLADNKARLIRSTRQEIAEAQGDTDAYIAQYSDQDLTHPRIAADAALRLLADGRAQDALDLLGPPDGQEDARWDQAYIASLLALGQVEGAQAHRWNRFCATLDPEFLRAYLKVLPDFDDIEAEDRAKAFVLQYPDANAALLFLLEWPDLSLAARLIETRNAELNGDYYEILTPAAEALRDRYPLAAVLCWRAMIDFALEKGRASRYGHAGDHLMDCAALDGEISDYGTFQSHLRYVETLRARHDRKTSFWARVG